MAEATEINGVGVAIAVAGLVVAWAGIRHVPVLDAFKDLAMGRVPTPPAKKAWQDVTVDGGTPAGVGAEPIGLSGGNSSVVQMAQQVAATPTGQANYCWGGGHTSNPCGARCFDCSGYVSCVMNRLGVMKGSMTTIGFLAWKGATTVPFGQRQPGDIAVNTHHMGIVLDGNTMLAARCTACGRPGVQHQKYGSDYKIRRVRTSSGPTPQAV